MASWQCKAKKAWPLGPDREWDGSAAEARLFDHFGFKGGTPDHEIAQCFLATDTESPDLEGSYRDPFCDVVDGEIKAMPAGVRACASRLPQTDIPEDVKSEGEAVIKAYEAKFPKDTEASGELAMQAARMRTHAPAKLGAITGNGPIPIHIDAVAIGVPSPMPPICEDGLALPVVLPLETMDRDHVTMADRPIRFAAMAKGKLPQSHKVSATSNQDAPVRGAVKSSRFEARGEKLVLVLDGYIWPDECTDAELSALRDPQNVLGASLEWTGVYDTQAQLRVCQQFRGTGVAILAQDAAAWRDNTSLQMAASSADITTEETDMPKTEAEVKTHAEGEDLDMMAEDAVTQDGQPAVDPSEPEAEPTEAAGEPQVQAAPEPTMADLFCLLQQVLTLLSNPPHEEVEEELKDKIEEAALADCIEDLQEGEALEDAALEGVMPTQAESDPSDYGSAGAGAMGPLPDDEGSDNNGAAACNTQGGAMTFEQRMAAAGITEEDLKEHDREVLMQAAASAPDGTGVAHVNMQAAASPAEPSAPVPTLLDEGYRLAAERGLKGLAISQFAFDYVQKRGGAASR